MSTLANLEKIINDSNLKVEEKRILKNSIRSERRKRIITDDNIERYSSDLCILKEYDKLELLEKLEEVINLLEENEMKIIIALYFKDQKISSIINQLNISKSTLQRKKNKILEKLKRLLIERWIDYGDWKFRKYRFNCNSYY